MKKRYLMALFAGCTLLMIGCSNQQKDPATDPDAPAVTDNTGLTEGEADIAGQGTDMDTGTAVVNGTKTGSGQRDESVDGTTAGNGQNDANDNAAVDDQKGNAGSQSSEANTTGSPAVSTGKKSTASSNKSSKTTEKQNNKQTGSSGLSEDIGMEAAKKIALGKAGLTEQNGSWKKEKRDRENGRIVYELEFVSGNVEYEFEIDAQHGKILEYQQDPMDD